MERDKTEGTVDNTKLALVVGATTPTTSAWLKTL